MYRVKEIFYTLQGEGGQAGRPAIFLRFAGCNMWSGREEDRDKGPGTCSAWCDTDFVSGKRYDAEALADKVAETGPARFVVCTGGEPLLQLDNKLARQLQLRGFEIAVETNGTIPLPCRVDWLCVSPKAGSECILKYGQELKLVYPQVGVDPEQFTKWRFKRFSLQPMDGPSIEDNIKLTIDYCLQHPLWHLSLQTHKYIGLR